MTSRRGCWGSRADKGMTLFVGAMIACWGVVGETGGEQRGGGGDKLRSEITVEAVEQARTLWVANMEFQIVKERDYVKASIIEIATKLYETNKNYNDKDALELMTKLDEVYRSSHQRSGTGKEAAAEFASSVIDVLKSLKGPNPDVISAGLAILKPVITTVKQQHASVENPLYLRAFPTLNRVDTSSLSPHRTAVLENAHRLASKNATFARVLDTYLAKVGRDVSVNDLPAQVLRKNPDFANNEMLKELVKTAGENKVELEKLKKLHAAAFQRLHKQIEAAAKVGEKRNTTRTLGTDVKASEEAAAGVYILSRLFHFVNPRLGQAVSVTGTSLIQIADSINRFNVGAIGSLALTGNILGAVLNVFSLFEQDQRTDQLILEEVRAIRKDLDVIRKEMHERFDVIDKNLAIIAANLGNTLPRIIADLETVKLDVKQALRGLAFLSLRLEQINSELRDYLKELYGRPFEEALDALEHDRFHTSKMKPDVFDQHINTFRLYGTRFSRRGIEAGKAGAVKRSEKGDPVIGLEHALKLRAEPLEMNVNLLAQAAAILGNDKISDRLPNYSTWTVAANGYMLLMTNHWEDYGKKSKAAVTDAFLDTGAELQSAFKTLTLRFPKAGCVARTSLLDLLDKGAFSAADVRKALAAQVTAEGDDPDFFISKAVANYRRRLQEYYQAITYRRIKYQQEATAGIDIWGNPDQDPNPLKHKAEDVFSIKGISPAPGLQSPAKIPIRRTLTPPSNDGTSVRKFIPDQFITAKRLGLGNIDVFYDRVTHRPTKKEHARIEVRVAANFVFSDGKRTIPIFLRTMLSDREIPVPARLDPDSMGVKDKTSAPANEVEPAAAWWLGNLWDKITPPGSHEMRDGFIAKSTENLSEQTRTANLKEVRTAIVKNFDDRRQALHTAIVTDLKKQQDLDLVRSQIAVDGAVALLQSYIRLGMPSAFAHSDSLRTLLYGKDAISTGEVDSLLLSLIHSPETHQLLLRRSAELQRLIELADQGRMAIVRLRQEMSRAKDDPKKQQALQTKLSTLLDVLNVDRIPPEEIPGGYGVGIIDDTMHRLRLLRSMQELVRSSK